LHRLDYLAFPLPLARLGAGQVDAILQCQGFVDRLPLEPRGDEKLTRLEIIRGTITA